MRQFERIEFYITNVCNLTCEGCNRFNNISFRGWQNWSDYAATYATWGKHLEIKDITIMGGEPLLNPSILDWIRGLHQIWPNTPKQVLTNGTRLNQVPGLYQVCCDHKAWIGISMHNEDALEQLEKNIDQFLGGIKQRVEESSSIMYQGSSKLKVYLFPQYHFYQNALKNVNGRYTLHQSRAKVAHKNCSFRINKNYHFIRGKLYKCGPVALFPEIHEQFVLDLSAEDLKLLHSYAPLTLDDYDARQQDFFENLDNLIPQCKFCPEYFTLQKISATVKGKKNNLFQ